MSPDPPLPPWPATPPSADGVVLREFSPDDLPMALDLATDPYVPRGWGSPSPWPR